MFKPRDKVICIRNDQCSLKKDEIYTVKGIIDDFVHLIEASSDEENGWFPERFKLAYIQEFDDKLEKILK